MDVRAKRRALRMMPYGFYILTTCHGEEINGFGMNWCTQCSFNPPLICCAVDKESVSHGMLQESKVFAVNILPGDQRELLKPFLVSKRDNPNKFEGIPYSTGMTGCPILEEAAAWVECKVVHIIETGGDHTLFIGEVIEAGVRQDVPALMLQETGMKYGG